MNDYCASYSRSAHSLHHYVEKNNSEGFISFTTQKNMALTTGFYPFIEDVALKFERQSIKESFQLPDCRQRWQTKDYALYLQPKFGFTTDTAVLRTVSPFEFKANGDFMPKKNDRAQKQANKATIRHSSRNSPKRSTDKKHQLTVSQQFTMDSGRVSPVKANKSIASKALEFESAVSDSEDDEISGFFFSECSKGRTCVSPKTTDIKNRCPLIKNHTRKRSIEEEDHLSVKRICRPSLNFDKMLLHNVDINASSYFIPIAP